MHFGRKMALASSLNSLLILYILNNSLNTFLHRKSDWTIQARWPQTILHHGVCKTFPTVEDYMVAYLQLTMRRVPNHMASMGQHSLVVCQCPTPILPRMWTWLLLYPRQLTWTQLQILLSLILKLWMNPRRRNMQRRHGRARSQPLPYWSELGFVEGGWELWTPQIVYV